MRSDGIKSGKSNSSKVIANVVVTVLPETQVYLMMTLPGSTFKTADSASIMLFCDAESSSVPLASNIEIDNFLSLSLVRFPAERMSSTDILKATSALGIVLYTVGEAVGPMVSETVGTSVGVGEGCQVCLGVGTTVGPADGLAVGRNVGDGVGTRVGVAEGS